MYLDSDESAGGGGLEDSSEEGCCWVCQGVIEDPGDLFYPCNCKLHKKCIKQWVAKVSVESPSCMEESCDSVCYCTTQRASNANIPEKEYLKCQVCRRRVSKLIVSSVQ